MKTLCCPMNGSRNINEFLYGGELELDPGKFLLSDEKWARSLYFKYNGTDTVLEWWQHRASGYWFIVERNRLSNEVVNTFDPQHFYSQKIDYHELKEKHDSNSLDQHQAAASSEGTT